MKNNDIDKESQEFKQMMEDKLPPFFRYGMIVLFILTCIGFVALYNEYYRLK